METKIEKPELKPGFQILRESAETVIDSVGNDENRDNELIFLANAYARGEEFLPDGDRLEVIGKVVKAGVVISRGPAMNTIVENFLRTHASREEIEFILKEYEGWKVIDVDCSHGWHIGNENVNRREALRHILKAIFGDSRTVIVFGGSQLGPNLSDSID